jgi:type IV pilus assembly protein PilV
VKLIHHSYIAPSISNEKSNEKFKLISLNKMRMQTSTARYTQSGFSLIEIMIAAVILSIGILGVVSLQVISMKGTHQSYMKHQAMSIVQSLTERMRSNTAGLVAGNYQQDSNAFACNVPPVCNTPASNCSAAEIATLDLHNVFCGYGTTARTGGIKVTSADDKVILASGSVNIVCLPAGVCATGDVTITVGWAERQVGKEIVTADANGATDYLVVNTRIRP